jgi:hypothetical protein
MSTSHLRKFSVDFSQSAEEVAESLGLVNGDVGARIKLKAYDFHFGGTYRSVGKSDIACEHVTLPREYPNHHDVVSDLLTDGHGRTKRPLPFLAMLAAAKEHPELGTENIVTSLVAIANTKELGCCDKMRHIMCLAPKNGGRVLRCVTHAELHAKGTGYLVLDI